MTKDQIEDYVHSHNGEVLDAYLVIGLTVDRKAVACSACVPGDDKARDEINRMVQELVIQGGIPLLRSGIELEDAG